jgi:UDP-N-acetylmuramate: L-alanyl-gamma-D-glutamyl-meso-diaminopimelate ligase
VNTGHPGTVSPDYQVAEREIIGGRNHFAVKFKGVKIADVALKSPGEHNALNAISTFVIARELGWPIGNALQALADFQGVKRRQEVIGTPSGITLIEDFAHHPTAVKVTSEAIKEKYFSGAEKNAGRLICLFEPRSATSRRKVFQKDYVSAFQSGDKIIIAKAYDQSKISEGERFSTQELVSDIKASGREALEFDTTDEIVSYLKKDLRKGDVVLIMSNGGFDGIYQKLQKTL